MTLQVLISSIVDIHISVFFKKPGVYSELYETYDRACLTATRLLDLISQYCKHVIVTHYYKEIKQDYSAIDQPSSSNYIYIFSKLFFDTCIFQCVTKLLQYCF